MTTYFNLPRAVTISDLLMGQNLAENIAQKYIESADNEVTHANLLPGAFAMLTVDTSAASINLRDGNNKMLLSSLKHLLNHPDPFAAINSALSQLDLNLYLSSGLSSKISETAYRHYKEQMPKGSKINIEDVDKYEKTYKPEFISIPRLGDS